MPEIQGSIQGSSVSFEEPANPTSKRKVTSWKERVEQPVTGAETCTGWNIRFAQLSDHQPATLVYTKRPLLAHVAGKVFPESKKQGMLQKQFSVQLQEHFSVGAEAKQILQGISNLTSKLSLKREISCMKD